MHRRTTPKCFSSMWRYLYSPFVPYMCLRLGVRSEELQASHCAMTLSIFERGSLMPESHCTKLLLLGEYRLSESDGCTVEAVEMKLWIPRFGIEILKEFMLFTVCLHTVNNISSFRDFVVAVAIFHCQRLETLPDKAKLM